MFSYFLFFSSFFFFYECGVLKVKWNAQYACSFICHRSSEPHFFNKNHNIISSFKDLDRGKKWPHGNLMKFSKMEMENPLTWGGMLVPEQAGSQLDRKQLCKRGPQNFSGKKGM